MVLDIMKKEPIVGSACNRIAIGLWYRLIFQFNYHFVQKTLQSGNVRLLLIKFIEAWKYSHLLAILIFFDCILFSCNSLSSKYYQNQEWNFGLEYPTTNWVLIEGERVANEFALQGETGFGENGKARIYVNVELPFQAPLFTELELTDMENYLDIINQRKHVISSMNVKEISEVIDLGSYQMIWATITIPTLEIVDGSLVNQMEQRTENVTQIINIYIFENTDGQRIIAELYKGTDENLNLQAEAIVQSITFIK